jgi:CubicO group peptidase (beta-lactamase class C family)
MFTRVKTHRSVACGLVGLLVATWLALPAAAGEAPSNGVPADVFSANSIEQWADATFGKAVAEHRVSGLGFTVTDADKVIFIKGYGYQDWASQKPFDPNVTKTRTASTTKQFIGVSVAQLLERGKIASLDDPVNKYLKRFQLPPNNGKQVTIWDLLTHRGGFASNGGNLEFTAETTKTPMSGEIINSVLPGYARPADTVSVYCNICVGILGFMIEDVSGHGLPDYLEENIYKPLAMTRTELSVGDQPPADMIVQYAFVENGVAVPLPYPTLSPLIAAAGSTTSTTADYTKWLMANLQEGSGPLGRALLSDKTWKLAHTQHRANYPGASGFGMMFFTYDYNGERVMEQYGSLQHRSMIFWLMDKKIGIFVTMAGGGRPGEGVEIPTGGGLAKVSGSVEPAISHSGARALILEHFLGKLPFDRSRKVDLAKYTGDYQNIARNPNSNQPANILKVADSGDGGLLIDGRGVFRPSGRDTFTLDRPLELQAGFGVSNKYVFATDASGKVTGMFGHINAGGYERVTAQ